MKNEEKWQILLKEAQKKNAKLPDPVIPYNEKHIVGKHNGLNNGNIVVL